MKQRKAAVSEGMAIRVRVWKTSLVWRLSRVNSAEGDDDDCDEDDDDDNDVLVGCGIVLNK